MFPKTLIQSCLKPISLPGPTIQAVELSFCSFLSNSEHEQSSKAQQQSTAKPFKPEVLYRLLSLHDHCQEAWGSVSQNLPVPSQGSWLCCYVSKPFPVH